jgi:hypothetical protein
MAAISIPLIVLRLLGVIKTSLWILAAPIYIPVLVFLYYAIPFLVLVMLLGLL